MKKSLDIAAKIAGLGLGAVLFLVHSGCGGSVKKAVADDAGGPVEVFTVGSGFFAPGEQLTFRLSLKGIEGGEAMIAFGNPGLAEGRRIMIVRSLWQTAGVVEMFRQVRDDVTSWIDMETGYPVYSRSDLKFGKKESIVETRFADGKPGSFSLKYHRSGRRAVTLRQRLAKEETVLDTHSTLAAIRGWRSQEGASAQFYVLAGRTLWVNKIRHRGVEKIKTEFGTVDAVRIEGTAQRLTRGMSVDKRKKMRDFTVWVTDDGRRLPVLAVGKTEYGDIRAELVTHRQSPRAMSRRP